MTAYAEEVSRTSDKKLREYNQLPPHRRWIWILGAGTIREDKPDAVNNNRVRRLAPGIQAGKSVNAVNDKDDEDQCLNAFYEYLNILCELESEHLKIYTDGSHCPKDESTGYGIRIVHHSYGREKSTTKRRVALCYNQ